MDELLSSYSYHMRHLVDAHQAGLVLTFCAAPVGSILLGFIECQAQSFAELRQHILALAGLIVPCLQQNTVHMEPCLKTCMRAANSTRLYTEDGIIIGNKYSIP